MNARRSCSEDAESVSDREPLENEPGRPAERLFSGEKAEFFAGGAICWPVCVHPSKHHEVPL